MMLPFLLKVMLVMVFKTQVPKCNFLRNAGLVGGVSTEIDSF